MKLISLQLDSKFDVTLNAAKLEKFWFLGNFTSNLAHSVIECNHLRYFYERGGTSKVDKKTELHLFDTLIRSPIMQNISANRLFGRDIAKYKFKHGMCETLNITRTYRHFWDRKSDELNNEWRFSASRRRLQRLGDIGSFHRNFKHVKIDATSMLRLTQIAQYFPEAVSVHIFGFAKFRYDCLNEFATLPNLQSLKLTSSQIDLDALLACLLVFKGPLVVDISGCNVMRKSDIDYERKLEELRSRGIDVCFESARFVK